MHKYIHPYIWNHANFREDVIGEIKQINSLSSDILTSSETSTLANKIMLEKEHQHFSSLDLYKNNTQFIFSVTLTSLHHLHIHVWIGN